MDIPQTIYQTVYWTMTPTPTATPTVTPTPTIIPDSPLGLPYSTNNAAQEMSQGYCGVFSHKSGDVCISALDFSIQGKTKLTAIMGGILSFYNSSSGSSTSTCTHEQSLNYGCYVIITNPSTGYAVLIAHLDTSTYNRWKTEGQYRVGRGDFIGFSDDSGFSTESHIHVEIRKGDSENFFLKSFVSLEDLEKVFKSP